MGLLIEGQWHDEWYDTDADKGHFVRKQSQFRNRITPDGAGNGEFKAEAGRYHLYVSYACPWAHRVLILRAIKGLEDVISLSVVHPLMGQYGWSFENGEDVIPDSIHGAEYLYQVYRAAQADYTGRVTVPILWDRQTGTIVSNESSDIIRMLGSAFDNIGARPGDYYPAHLKKEIDALNRRIYATVNNGVYKAGFATAQEAYEEAVVPLFESLDWLEDMLSRTRYLTGPQVTEADWRLFTTLVRFDAVYVGHFKCNLKTMAEYPNLSGYIRDLYQQPGVAGTVNMSHIKRHYYQSHQMINPTGVIPMGPVTDFAAPHNRGILTDSDIMRGKNNG